MPESKVSSLKVGKAAPKFKLENHEGEFVSLNDIEEDYIVLFFYPKDNTPGCTLEAQGFSKLKNKLSNISTIAIGISGGDLKSKQKFCNKAKLDVMLLSDPDGSIGEKYDSYGEKKFMGKTYTGFHRKTFLIGPDRKILKIFDTVKPQDHPDEVLEFIKSL